MLRVKSNNLIGWEYETNSLRVLRTLALPSRDSWCWPKRSSASGDENDFRRKKSRKEKQNVGSEELRVVCEFDQPLLVPSSPMIIFMDDNICMTTGGDMKDAYAALCEVPRIWFIISWKSENTDSYIISYSTSASGMTVLLNCSDTITQ